MASACSPWFYRKVLYKIPGLFKQCPEGNYHWRWHRLCFCRLNQGSPDWSGGVMDFKTGEEYIPVSEYKRMLSQWHEAWTELRRLRAASYTVHPGHEMGDVYCEKHEMGT
jgi:hypothetical protein